MHITPDTVVYVDKTRTRSPEHDLFAVVAVEAANKTKTPVKATGDNGGSRWKTPDGHTVEAGNSKGAAQIAPTGFTDGGPTVKPHAYRVNTVAFDITTAERGGTLTYRDGDGTEFRWKIPARNSGTAVPALKSALQ
ncbi:hypothetical protein [Streptomyces spirodelae]|uniref:Uncharacterized protein n=1 Tax=Streptomyces spirodelae TaxID=2812904 RepID=A0ABS3WLS9_9ACTN|nr:hypothetical protein [Streptomyces spirodelae]MBO8184053.1 hypothetical protein [Streptomyces spirodelae]